MRESGRIIEQAGGNSAWRKGERVELGVGKVGFLMRG